MLLAIDIGNTNINTGIFANSRIRKKYNIQPNLKKYCLFFKKIFSRYKIDAVIISSVVPKTTEILTKSLKTFFSKQPLILGKDLSVPIKNRYRYPKQVGQDRLVNGFAVVRLYGSPAIVIDFGTAITFDVLSKKKEYLGGMILPGLEISLDALVRRTALLPKIKLAKPKGFIGRDTKNSMLSGIVYGFALLVDGLVERIKKTIGKDAVVIGTGGNIGLMAGYCKKINKVDKDLILKGLGLIYRRYNLLNNKALK